MNKSLIEEIEKLAYELYEKSGYIEGCEIENWLEAERIVMERYAVETELVRKKKTPRKTTTKRSQLKKRTSAKKTK